MRRAAIAGLIAAAAGAGAGCSRDRPITDAVRAREHYVHDLAAREDLLPAWSLTSRSDLQFEDGMAAVDLVGQPPTPGRWMGPRAHLRIRGDRDGDRRLAIRGRVDIDAMHTRPIVAASIDGRELSSALVALDGTFVIATVVAGRATTEWSDVYVTLSSVHEPWKDPEGRTAGKLAVARIEAVTWEPIAAPPTGGP